MLLFETKNFLLLSWNFPGRTGIQTQYLPNMKNRCKSQKCEVVTSYPSLVQTQRLDHCTGCAVGVSETTELDQEGVQQSTCVHNRERCRGQGRVRGPPEGVLPHCKSTSTKALG